MPASPEGQVSLELLRQGDEGAARQVVEKYLDRLLTLARKRIGQRLLSRIDPEDITQSVFRTVFQRARDGRLHFQDEDGLCKLLTKITLHKTLRRIEFHQASKRHPAREAGQGSRHHERLMALLSHEPSPEAAVVFMDELKHFLGYLTPTERKIIELRLLGYGNQDIADQLELKYDRKIRRLVEHVRAVAERVGLGGQRLTVRSRYGRAERPATLPASA
jgi:RNA polymerase sigma-70 factor (ECF subfamily)